MNTARLRLLCLVTEEKLACDSCERTWRLILTFDPLFILACFFTIVGTVLFAGWSCGLGLFRTGFQVVTGSEAKDHVCIITPVRRRAILAVETGLGKKCLESTLCKYDPAFEATVLLV